MDLVGKLYEFYESRREDLLKDHRGEFALLAEDDVKGIFADRETALQTGLTEYGAGNFIVQQILSEDDAVIEFHTRVMIPAK